MARIFLALAFLFLFESVSFATPVAPKVGRWLFSFAIKDNHSIPIEIQVVNRDKIEIFNHTERIILQKTAQNGDTSVYDFPDFFAQLHVVWKKRKSAFGYFLNKNKSNKIIQRGG